METTKSASGLAIGAPAGVIVRLATIEISSMVRIGAIAGLALGFWSIRYVAELLYDVKARAVSIFVLPFLILFGGCVFAAIPRRFARCDSTQSLCRGRNEPNAIEECGVWRSVRFDPPGPYKSVTSRCAR